MHLIKNKCSSKIDFKEKGKIISYLNIYNYKILRNKKELLKQIDYYTFDGFLFQYLFFLLTGKLHKRLAPDFGSYFSEMFSYMNQNKESVYFIGAKKEELGKFKVLINTNYSNLNIAGACDGYFRRDQEEEVLYEVVNAKPDKIIIGLGTPKQEEFSIKIKETCPQALVFNCGAFISQTANHGTSYYPKLINQLNLRWLYRIFKEKGLLKRYALEYPIGVFFLLKDRFIQ